MSKLFGEIVENCISEFMKAEFFYNFTNEKIDIRQIVKEHHFLPILFDWSAFCSLRPNGEIVWFDLDNHKILKVETDERIRNIVMFKATEKFPKLLTFLPQRTNENIDCPYCESTNQLPKEISKGVTCYCGELGWIPKE